MGDHQEVTDSMFPKKGKQYYPRLWIPVSFLILETAFDPWDLGTNPVWASNSHKAAVTQVTPSLQITSRANSVPSSYCPKPYRP